MSKERIVCPAIKYTLRNAGNNKFIERVVLCTNYDDSFIEEAVKEMKRNRFFYKYREERGFMTSEERFVLLGEAEALKGSYE